MKTNASQKAAFRQFVSAQAQQTSLALEQVGKLRKEVGAASAFQSCVAKLMRLDAATGRTPSPAAEGMPVTNLVGDAGESGRGSCNPANPASE